MDGGSGGASLHQGPGVHQTHGEGLRPRPLGLVSPGAACILARFRTGRFLALVGPPGIRMELFFQFVLLKWYLFTALAVIAALLIVHETRKGVPTLSPLQATALVNREDAVLIDLRDNAEFRAGHIVDSVHMPVGKLSERIAELERYRERPVVVVCKMGHQSGAVAKTLREKGFTRVYRLGGGILEWQSAQLPLVRS